MANSLTIGQYKFNSLHSAKIKSSWDMFTDTAEIVIPKKVDWNGKNIAFGDGAILRSGQAVNLSIGYEDYEQKDFTGFVRHVHTDLPVRIECEDHAIQLKKGEITGAYRQVMLSELIKDVVGDIPSKVTGDYEIKQLRFTRVTPIQLLDKLRKKYGFKAWFRDGTLYAGLAIVPELQKSHVMRFDRNVISENLEYRRAEDVRIKVKGIVIGKDNKKEEVIVGDPDGEVRTFNFYDESLADVKVNLEEQLERLRYTGFRGSLTTFLAPNVQHGDFVKLINTEHPEQDGTYIVKSVDSDFSPDGGRQELTLDTKVL